MNDATQNAVLAGVALALLGGALWWALVRRPQTPSPQQLLAAIVFGMMARMAVFGIAIVGVAKATSWSLEAFVGSLLGTTVLVMAVEVSVTLNAARRAAPPAANAPAGESPQLTPPSTQVEPLRR